MNCRTFLLLAALLPSCGHGRPDRTPQTPIPQIRTEGSWSAMVEVLDDSSGDPISTVRLQVLRMADLEDGNAEAPVALGITDSSGRYTFGELPGEACLIRAVRDGYRPNALSAPPPAGDSGELVRLEIRLAPLE